MCDHVISWYAKHVPIVFCELAIIYIFGVSMQVRYLLVGMHQKESFHGAHKKMTSSIDGHQVQR
jgi:hypothetical protein